MRFNPSSAGRLFAGLILVSLTCGVASAEDYKVKLTRPEKVGNEYKISVTATQSRTLTGTANGVAMPPKKDKFTAELTGKLKVEEVDEKFGQPTKLSVTVEKLTKDGNELYPAGTVITVSKEGKEKTFMIAGEEADKNNAEVLSALLSVEKKDKKMSDDQTMGTDKPQAVGATWKVDADNVAKETAEDDVTVSPDNIKGQSTLVEVKEADSVKLMTVKTEFKLEDVKFDAPNGVKIDDGTMSVTLTSVLPVDPALPEVSSEEKVNMSMGMTLPNNGGTVTLHSEETKKMTLKKVD